MEDNIENFSNLPPEILEEIFKYFKFHEVTDVLKLVNKQFQAVANNVIKTGFKSLGNLIENLLEKKKNELLYQHITCDENVENSMRLVAQYTKLQILQVEYHMLYVLCWKPMLPNSIDDGNNYISGKILDEFYHLLQGSEEEKWNWKSGNYLNTEMDQLLEFNSQRTDFFFWNLWDKFGKPFGPILLGIIACSLQSTYELQINYETADGGKTPAQNSWCDLQGFYEIEDINCTMPSPPSDMHGPNTNFSTRLIAYYLHDAIRWGNLFQTLKLRWICMDRALAQGTHSQNTNENGVSFLQFCDLSFLNESPIICKESLLDLDNGKQRVQRKLERNILKASSSPGVSSDLGVRCEFHIRCPVDQAPHGLIDLNWNKISVVNDENCTSKVTERPTTTGLAGWSEEYLFQMELKVRVKALKQANTIQESIFWLDEIGVGTKITHSKRYMSND